MGIRWWDPISLIEPYFNRFWHRRTEGGNPDADTRLSWARRIESPADVPAWAGAFFDGLLAQGGEFPYAVLTPSFEGFLRREAEKIVCLAAGRLCLLVRKGGGYARTACPLEELRRMEVREVLLDGGIRFFGIDERGAPVDFPIRFNAVTDHLFIPIVEAVRAAGGEGGKADPAAQMAVFDAWAGTGFKFMNYARRSLPAGDTVERAILQTEIRRPLLRLFGRSIERPRSPAHACILSDRELILIRDDLESLTDARYGGVWDYLPRGRILSAAAAQDADGFWTLRIQIEGGGRLERLFAPDAGAELSKLVEAFARAPQTRMAAASTA